MNNYDLISIKALEFEACHGVLEKEKYEKQKFLVDLDIYLYLKFDEIDDDINKTISYADIAFLVQKIVENQSFDLIESLCSKINYEVLNFSDKIAMLKTTVHKPDAPINLNFKDVSVSMIRKK